MNNITHSKDQIPLILQKSTIVAALRNSLWTTNVEVDRITQMFNVLTRLEQCVGVIGTKLNTQQFNALLT